MASDGGIAVGLAVGVHPHLKFRIDHVRDLRTVPVTSISHGAFMGDVVLRLPGGDFTSHSGWRGLVEWRLPLHHLVGDVNAFVRVRWTGGSRTQTGRTRCDKEAAAEFRNRLAAAERQGRRKRWRLLAAADFRRLSHGWTTDKGIADRRVKRSRRHRVVFRATPEKQPHRRADGQDDPVEQQGLGRGVVSGAVGESRRGI